MKKIKFDKLELDIIVTLIERKLEKLNEKEVDEFSIEYSKILKGLLNIYLKNMVKN